MRNMVTLAHFQLTTVFMLMIFYSVKSPMLFVSSSFLSDVVCWARVQSLVESYKRFQKRCSRISCVTLWNIENAKNRMSNQSYSVTSQYALVVKGVETARYFVMQ